MTLLQAGSDIMAMRHPQAALALKDTIGAGGEAGRFHGTRPRIQRGHRGTAGLSASIHDPLDEELTHAMRTAELLLNKAIYSDSYVKAYRQKP